VGRRCRSTAGRVHVLEREQVVAVAPAEAWEFFGDAGNLEAITPPFLRFRVVTPPPIVMGVGTLIEYRLRLHGIRVSWLTRIEAWAPGRRFVDRQVRGPYALWHHTHSFEPHPGGTLMRDRVRYRLPLGPLGALARLTIVHRDLEAIFDFRRRAIERRLGRG
jgi:ligand-binding SRPBCC domain-containing protein